MGAKAKVGKRTIHPTEARFKWGRVCVLTLALVAAGCASSHTITLSYDAPISARASQRPTLIIGPFEDVRGNEGDHGDPFRVGGIYGGYGNRLAKVMVARPWPPQLREALAAEFRAVGVETLVSDQVAAATGDPPLILGGEIRNFSTESRWGREAHIGVIVRIRSPERVLVEKRVDVRESGYHWNNFNTEILEALLNRVFAQFVRTVATDPDLAAALRAHARRPSE